ncbi:DUF4437 domain-containing protein [Undibacterium curvum]|uniref:DUF4437 domain-containing protein n=1 Tax=Undibacterium curvum TaxID=2762294 RepID=UPI003D0A238D
MSVLTRVTTTSATTSAVKKLVTAVMGALVMTVASAATAASGDMLIKPFEQLQFSEKVPGNPQISPVKGIPETQPSSIVMKMGRGAFPLHTHTANYQLVVIKGIMKHWDEKGSQKSAPKMGPGSYWYQPAGQVHGDACESNECVWFITFDGPRDFAVHQ